MQQWVLAAYAAGLWPLIQLVFDPRYTISIVQWMLCGLAEPYAFVSLTGPHLWQTLLAVWLPSANSSGFFLFQGTVAQRYCFPKSV